ncbi:DNA-binding protein reb1 [Neolecta irregularis DAH-3]|uniref:DNA-binding protein reb1 n=1 Tax=Neolecta irregularis (strain DAH-3) TaxID=1198029 RepID=A0A1U7LHD0_NEOID|nr:DNA-binding protein reb1 [Neolecta irregularis DAH-3]|eukprot:OLL22003.1 DNA-binding protein reb1 [Neolecta irregularis DAH-3]
MSDQDVFPTPTRIAHPNDQRIRKTGVIGPKNSARMKTVKYKTPDKVLSKLVIEEYPEIESSTSPVIPLGTQKHSLTKTPWAVTPGQHFNQEEIDQIDSSANTPIQANSGQANPIGQNSISRQKLRPQLTLQQSSPLQGLDTSDKTDLDITSDKTDLDITSDKTDLYIDTSDKSGSISDSESRDKQDQRPRKKAKLDETTEIPDNRVGTSFNPTKTLNRRYLEKEDDEIVSSFKKYMKQHDCGEDLLKFLVTGDTLDLLRSIGTRLNRPANGVRLRAYSLFSGEAGNDGRVKVGGYYEGQYNKEERAIVERCIQDWELQHGMNRDQFVEMMYGMNRRLCRAFLGELSERLPLRAKPRLRAFIRRNYHPHRKTAVWTREEDDQLEQLVMEHGRRWRLIGVEIDRRSEDVRDRYRNYVKHRGTQKMGAWTGGELQQLSGIVADLLQTYSVLDIPWNVVSERMGGKRSKLQCAFKWKNMEGRTHHQRSRILRKASFAGRDKESEYRDVIG